MVAALTRALLREGSRLPHHPGFGALAPRPARRELLELYDCPGTKGARHCASLHLGCADGATRRGSGRLPESFAACRETYQERHREGGRWRRIGLLLGISSLPLAATPLRST
jgi:hypothetical protein